MIKGEGQTFEAAAAPADDMERDYADGSYNGCNYFDWTIGCQFRDLCILPKFMNKSKNCTIPSNYFS